MLALAVVLVGCAPKDGADLVFLGGVVRTMDDGAVAEAVVVDEGLIAYVGDKPGAKAHIGRDTDVVRLRGRTLLPGFVDAHNHLLWSGTELLDVDLWEATTIDELLDPVIVAAAEQDGWIRGGGWDNALFDGQLHKGLLDEAVPGRPVYMASSDAHSAWVSSAALAAAGITAATPDPAGGIIVRDGEGEPTGILREDAMALVEDLLPEYPDEQVDQGLEDALVEATYYGITTVVDPLVEEWMLQGYVRRDEAGTLGLRVFGAVAVTPEDPAGDVAAAVALRGAYASDHVVVNGVKLYMDGVIETQTALLLAPYVDGTVVDPLFTEEQLHLAVDAADDAGLQLHVHAIGDGAVRQILDAIEWLEGQNGERDRRPLLAHLELIDPADVPRFAELGAHADVQALWAYPDPYIVDLTWPFIGPERSEWLYPIGALYEADATVVAGSDWSVTTMNPFEAMEVAVTRRDPWDPEGEILTPQHRVSAERFLRAFTIDGARAVFLEDEIGSITVGKRADLVIVDRDPLDVDPADLSDLVVEGTYFEGDEVER